MSVARKRTSGLFPELKEFDLEAHYKKQILDASNNFEATDALVNLYVESDKDRSVEMKEFISEMEIRFKLNPTSDRACKLGILYEHLPEEKAGQYPYANTWLWYQHTISMYRPESPNNRACGEAHFRIAKMIQANKGEKFAGSEHIVKERYECAFDCGVVHAAYELGQLYLNDALEGDVSEAVFWFEKGMQAGDTRCEQGLAAAVKLKGEIEAEVTEERERIGIKL